MILLFLLNSNQFKYLYIVIHFYILFEQIIFWIDNIIRNLKSRYIQMVIQIHKRSLAIITVFKVFC